MADEELLRAAREAGFCGPLYDKLTQTLAQYGLPVVHSWLTSGFIYKKTAEFGRPVKMPVPALTPHEIDDLTHETVATAIDNERYSESAVSVPDDVNAQTFLPATS